MRAWVGVAGVTILAMGTAGGAAVAATRCTVSRVAELPVTMDGLKPMVEAQINGHPVRLVADSGGFYSLLSPAAAAELKLPLTPAPLSFTLRGIGGATTASITTVKQFTVAGVTIPNIQFLVGGSEISGGAGLVGQNVLGFRDAEYDLGGGMIRLMETHDCAAESLAYWAPPGTPIAVVTLEPRDQRNPHIVGTVSVNGQRLRALFDTGAATSSLTQAAAARLGVHPNDPGVRPAGYARGLGSRTLPSWTATFASLAIGDEQIRNIRLRFTANPDANYDMLLGADFFLSHHVYVANGLHRLVLTYKGGPVFDLGRAPGAAAPVPPSDTIAAAAPAPAPAATADAGGLGREAAALAARGDMAGALAAYDRALAASPDAPALLAGRARAHLALRQPLLAAQDLDRALQIAPDEPETRLVRAELRLAARDPAGARADLDTLAAKLPPQANARFTLAALYSRLDALPEAIAQYDLWLTGRAEDSRRPDALNGRCWARALLGRELPAALRDCDAAVRARPGWATALDSRGLVHLRQGETAKAIADYDAALKVQPKLAWSLYGRGLARQAAGDRAGGDADLAAAAVIAPALAANARAHGIVPAS